MKMKTLRPAKGRLVFDPLTRQALRAEGEPKPLNSYWRRRLLAGDVEVAKPSPKSKDK